MALPMRLPHQALRGQGPPGRDPAGRGEGHARPRDGGASGWTSARPHELDRRL